MKANDIEYSLVFLSKGRVNGLTEWAETLTIQVVILSVTRRSLQDGEPERGISENCMSELSDRYSGSAASLLYSLEWIL